MSTVIEWIAAGAEQPPFPAEVLLEEGHSESVDEAGSEPVEVAQDQPAVWSNDQERRVYRGRTIAMLRRYMRYSMETGRLPSLLGREFFRSNVTSYRVTTFEDRVIFVHDMEKCLDRLDDFSRQVLARVVLQEYEQEDAARILGCTRMTVHRKLAEALDSLIDILLEVKLLESLSAGMRKTCQEGEEDYFFVSDCQTGK